MRRLGWWFAVLVLAAAVAPLKAGGPAPAMPLAQADEAYEEYAEGEGTWGWIEGKVKDLWDKAARGGNTMWLLAFFSVMALAFILERAFRLRGRRIVPKGLVEAADRLWRQDRRDEIEAMCSRECPLVWAGDFHDLPGFCGRLVAAGEGGGPGQRFWSMLPPDAQSAAQRIAQASEASPPSDDDEAALMAGLNALLKDPGLYSVEAFGRVSLPGRAADLLAVDRQSLSDAQVQRLNRTLLEAAFPDQVSPPRRRRQSTLSRIIAFIAHHHNSPIPEVSAASGDIASRDVRYHLQRAYPLAVVATLSPLAGLFGTVWGMMEAFDRVVVAGTMGDPKILASSISKALITTAAGLLIAIPALGFYHFFRDRTHTHGARLEEASSDLINDWLLTKEAGDAS